MTIKTLEFIHTLLKEEAAHREDTRKYISEIYHKAVDENAPNVDSLHEQYRLARRKCNEAEEALEEFCSKEW